ncbi:hypothetical protein C1645_881939 [Glomus cerebriforme]|uniref:Uncharacterized protein n=1 Tax=Glomus cerebriforme TaxID=658196 RepID=A0A397S7T5_9GLOM|nr:hypothetical protein C1645_881939 [Glomus cerebriforme]
MEENSNSNSSTNSNYPRYKNKSYDKQNPRNHNKNLFTNSVLNKQELEKYCSLLEDYRDYRYNDIKAMKNLVSRAFNKLEKCGSVSNLSNQLYNLTISQKKLLRQMILNRIESFIDILSQSHIFEEKKKDLSLDNPIELRKEIESLRKQNNNLAQENSHYQASLGNMINTRLDDQDPNNATKLISDIKVLQHLLEEFTIVQGPEYRINKGKSIKLFSKNKSTESQRNPDEMIEVEILNTTERLIKSFNHFSEKRPGKDDITQIIPTKVRQQIYAALGCRGFSYENHPFYHRNSKRDNIHLMQGSWYDDVKKLEVEVCHFPYIMIPDSKNLSNRKILTKAQVYTRPKNTTGDGKINRFRKKLLS